MVDFDAGFGDFVDAVEGDANGLLVHPEFAFVGGAIALFGAATGDKLQDNQGGDNFPPENVGTPHLTVESRWHVGNVKPVGSFGSSFGGVCQAPVNAAILTDGILSVGVQLLQRG